MEREPDSTTATLAGLKFTQWHDLLQLDLGPHVLNAEREQGIGLVPVDLYGPKVFLMEGHGQRAVAVRRRCTSLMSLVETAGREVVNRVRRRIV